MDTSALVAVGALVVSAALVVLHELVPLDALMKPTKKVGVQPKVQARPY